MKLNNKGFAITSVLYGLLILFVVFTGTYLSLLGAKKNKLDNITTDIEAKYAFEKKLNDSISITNGSFTAPCIGKYKLNNNKYVYLYKGKTYTLSELSNDATSITEVYCQGSSE